MVAFELCRIDGLNVWSIDGLYSADPTDIAAALVLSNCQDR